MWLDDIMPESAKKKKEDARKKKEAEANMAEEVSPFFTFAFEKKYQPAPYLANGGRVLIR